MELFRLFAFTVEPLRTSSNGNPPSGGPVRLTKELRNLLDESIVSADFGAKSTAVFNVDQTTRTNPIRDSILNIGFGVAGEAFDAALDLAQKLSEAMDNRSDPCLFIIAALEDDGRRLITLWTFPRDEAFRFDSKKGTPSIEILTDVFSRTSKLRKAASFQGRKLRNEFLSGGVLDFQASKTSDEVANYWLTGFLQCGLSLKSDTATRLLAKTLKKAYESCDEFNDKEQLFVAMMGIRRSTRTRWSLQDFSDSYLSGRAKEEFLRAVPNEESLVSSFDFAGDEFDKAVQFRIFLLDTGVYVSSPPNQVGESVQISGDDEKNLKCEGRIIEDKMRVRHV